MNTSLHGLSKLPDVAIVTNLSNSTSKLAGVKEVRSHCNVIITHIASLVGVQEGGCGSSLLSPWNIGSCDQPSEPHPLRIACLCSIILLQSSLTWKLPDNVTVHPAYLLWQPFRLPHVADGNKSVSSLVE